MREPAPGLRPHERIASVPLGRLELSPDNARRTPANDAALAELKASIAAHGLLENLVVRPLGGEGAAARYAVIAGGVLTEEHLRAIGERVYGIVDGPRA